MSFIDPKPQTSSLSWARIGTRADPQIAKTNHIRRLVCSAATNDSSAIILLWNDLYLGGLDRSESVRFGLIQKRGVTVDARAVSIVLAALARRHYKSRKPQATRWHITCTNADDS